MSVQQGDQPQQLVYPVTETNPPTHHQSDGSFGAVFIVLAVIMVVSAIACFLGRLCNKRYSKLKPSKHGQHTNKKYIKPKRNAFQTKNGDLEFGFDKRFSSAKVAANGEPNMSPNMGRLNSFHEPNMGPNLGRTNLFHEPNMGPDLCQPNSFHESSMGPNMGRHQSFHEPNMEPNTVRPNSFHESNMGSNMGRHSSFRDPSVGRPDSFQEPYMGRPNSFPKGEYEDDQMRFGGNEDDQMNFKSGTGPQYY